ncbi:NAD(P)H-binding protein [Thioalbus denitrificans]|uniref:NADH dehydrogenase n=1 Tax=Thioalbus denitrificans TaxID=547122 RepID=A0A369CCZ6_9GAMM|nr:NAD(P)H-binding protein [Thioalbus denitrificans]RCX31779.1 NADH dehydrogenase [Thioalbus denitrificans]
MRVAVIGGTGFVGSYLVDALLAHGHTPVLMVRPGSGGRLRRPDSVYQVPGRVEDDDALRRCLEGVDAAVYNIGILREQPRRGITFTALHEEGARRAIDTAGEMGVKRFLLMSANGVRPDGTPYQRTKFAAEEYLRASGLEWTIFRPSLIFGDPRGQMEFCSMLREQMIRPPIPAPLFYEGLLPLDAGGFSFTPVLVRDVAEAFALSLERPETVGEVLHLGGPVEISWRGIIRTLAGIGGRRKLALPAPAGVVRRVAALMEPLGVFPVTADQVRMLTEGNSCDGRPAFELLGITPTPFGPDALGYLQSVQGARAQARAAGQGS